MADVVQSVKTPKKSLREIGKRAILLAAIIAVAGMMVAWVGLLGWGLLWLVGVV